MSRSYKKTPRSSNKKDKFFKQYANKIVRKINYTTALQHKGYKRFFCSWNICDYEDVGTTYRDYLKCISWYNELEDCKKIYQEYLHYYKRK